MTEIWGQIAEKRRNFMLNRFANPPARLYIGDEEWMQLKKLSQSTFLMETGKEVLKQTIMGMQIIRVRLPSHLEVA